MFPFIIGRPVFFCSNQYCSDKFSSVFSILGRKYFLIGFMITLVENKDTFRTKTHQVKVLSMRKDKRKVLFKIYYFARKHGIFFNRIASFILSNIK